MFGAHMSIAGGLEKALERGKKINCRTIQIFTKSSNHEVVATGPTELQFHRAEGSALFRVDRIIGTGRCGDNSGQPTALFRRAVIPADRCPTRTDSRRALSQI